MKIFFLISIFCGLSVSASVFSQNNKLTITKQGATVQEILNEIESNTEFKFFLQNEKINIDRKLDVNIKDKSIVEVLDVLFENSEVKYDISDKNLILISKSPKKSQSDKKVVTGVVTDNNGETMPGVSVMEKGTTNGVVTDTNGKFSIPISSDNTTLVFKFVGMKSEEVQVAGRKVINIRLKSDLSELDEVVVIGYGTLDKKELTSSVTSIKSKDMIQGVASSPLAAIQGKVTGLSIVSTNGSDPNSSVSIQLRGANSIHASQGPLVVIDGVPGGDINTVAKEDIKSIDVLKDASAGAIYGTRASGGVILITTKKAKEGPARVTYTGEFSTETIRKKAEVLSADDYLANKLGEDKGHRTDWFKEVTRELPLTKRHVLTVSGGSKAVRVYTSIFTKDAKGIALGSERKELGGRMNFDYKALNGKLDISGRLSYNQIKSSFTNNGIFNMALKLNPTETPYDAKDVTGLNVWKGGWEYYNPVAEIKLRESKNTYHKLLADVKMEFHITDYLKTSLMGSKNYSAQNPISWRSSQHKSSRDSGIRGYARQDFKNWTTDTYEWLVNFNKTFDQHSVKAMGGYSFQEFNGEGFYAQNEDFPVDGMKWYDMNSGTFLSEGRAKLGSFKNPRERLIAFFGRLNYSFNDRYLLSASVRREGSSKFAKDKRWGTFPAVSAGWRISEESFMQGLDFVDDLKIRGGYGETGNEGFGAGVSTRMYSSDTWWLVNGTWLKTYGLAHNQNADLEWERKKEINLGLDFSFLKGKITGKVDVYKRESDKLLYNISVSQPPAIHDRTRMNVGSLENKGIEAEITWNAIQTSDFDFTTTVKASHNKNKLVSLWGNQTHWDRKGFPAPGSPGSAVRLYPGEDIGRFYIWKFAGFTEEGNWMLYDKDGNAFDVTKRSKTNEDKQFVGNAIPKLRMSWVNNLRYKNFDLSLYFRGWFFYDVFNMIDMYYSLPNVKEQNVLKKAFNDHKNIKGEKELCDYWLEKGDFLKLDVVTLGYNLEIPSMKKYLRNIRLYTTVKNVFTLTKYSGLDPEVNINGLEPGFEELNVYPKTRIFTFGIQANF